MSLHHTEETKQFMLDYLSTGLRAPRHARNAYKRRTGIVVSEHTIRRWRDEAGLPKPSRGRVEGMVPLECADDHDVEDMVRNNRFKRVMALIKPLRKPPLGSKLDRTTPGR